MSLYLRSPRSPTFTRKAPLLSARRTRVALMSRFTVTPCFTFFGHRHALTFSDAFYDPHTWKNYDPNNPDATSPAPHTVIDTHQFWAFPPLTDLTPPQILQRVCALGAELKLVGSGIPPTLVGEWSLDTGKPIHLCTQHLRAFLTVAQAIQPTQQ